MRKTIYYCDYCEKELGNKTHISTSLNGGWVGKKGANWIRLQQVGGIYQFCNAQCLQRFFKNLGKEKKV